MWPINTITVIINYILNVNIKGNSNLTYFEYLQFMFKPLILIKVEKLSLLAEAIIAVVCSSPAFTIGSQHRFG